MLVHEHLLDAELAPLGPATSERISTLSDPKSFLGNGLSGSKAVSRPGLLAVDARGPRRSLAVLLAKNGLRQRYRGRSRPSHSNLESRFAGIRFSDDWRSGEHEADSVEARCAEGLSAGSSRGRWVWSCSRSRRCGPFLAGSAWTPLLEPCRLIPTAPSLQARRRGCRVPQ